MNSDIILNMILAIAVISNIIAASQPYNSNRGINISAACVLMFVLGIRFGVIVL